MKIRAIQTLALGVLVSAVTGYAQQTATPPATAPNPSVAPGAQSTPAKPTAPAQDPTATTSTTPAPPAQEKQDKGVSANKQAQQSQLPQSDATVGSLDTGGLSSSDLQQKIESALHSEPTLSGSNLTVSVTDDTINISGTVATGKDRTTASRIVQSFGENRKVKEKINVTGAKK